MDMSTYLKLNQWTHPLTFGCWKGQGIKWACPLVELIQARGISSTADELLASIFVNRTALTTVAKYDRSMMVLGDRDLLLMLEFFTIVIYGECSGN